jgi:hypothetical protein
MFFSMITSAIYPIGISLVVFSSAWLITANLSHRTEPERRRGTRVAVGLFVLACLLFVIPAINYMINGPGFPI